MNIYKTIMPAVVAVVALSAITATSASASPEWLTLAGKKVEEAKAGATTVGVWEPILKKIPALLGGGEIRAYCDGQLHETIGPLTQGKTEKVLNLAGTEEGKIKCEAKVSTNSVCKAGSAVSVEQFNLPWRTTLKTVEGVVIEEYETSPAGKNLGFKLECSGIADTCETKFGFILWIKNLAEGSEFAYNGTVPFEKCTIGEYIMLGAQAVLDYLVS